MEQICRRLGCCGALGGQLGALEPALSRLATMTVTRLCPKARRHHRRSGQQGWACSQKNGVVNLKEGTHGEACRPTAYDAHMTCVNSGIEREGNCACSRRMGRPEGEVAGESPRRCDLTIKSIFKLYPQHHGDSASAGQCRYT